MYKKLKLIFILILLPSFESYGQVNELSLMGIDTDSFTQGLLPESDVRQKELKETELRTNGEVDKETFKDTNYGYSGGESFNNPPQSKFSEEALEYFGYSYFVNGPDSFFSQANVPVPPNYLIGPDDVINIILYGNKNGKYELQVSRDGSIFFPEIGPLIVAGLTFGDMQNLINSAITSQLIGTQVSVTLGSLRTIDVFILGAANKPGMYSISALSNITNAIFESGGVDTSGSLRNIKLKRNGETIVFFDLYDLFLNGDTSNDSRLMQGDVIFIEPIGKTVGVRGEVNRSGIYELRNDEDLSDLIRFAGNLKPKANKTNSEILRIEQSSNSFNLLKISLEKTETRIQNGDVISIYPINNQIQNAVLLTGHTTQPGFYPINDNMKIADLLGSQNNLLELTDMNYVLIKRKDSSTQKYSFLQVDLEQVFSNSETDQNIKLKNQDEILLLPSLLSPDLITTRLIQDKFEIDEETNKLVLENEWKSPTYLRKSLMEETIDINQQREILQNQFTNSESASANMEEGGIRRYYEYSIYDYCAIPQDIAVLVAEQTGFKVEKTVPLEELENLKTTEDFLSLKQAIESERIETKNRSQNNKEDITTTITNLCRQQLLKPYLDVVKRDNFTEKMGVINVYGSIHFPGSYPYTNNMSLADAIKAAGGPQNGTYKSEIEVTSLNNAGKKFSSSNTVFSMDQANTVSLSAMDTVHLKQISSDIKTVELTGEVYFPGIYPISENQTLSQLIRRAGGYTEYASPEAAFFQREALKKAEEERLNKAQGELRRKIVLSSQAGGLGQNSLSGNAITQLTALVTMDNNQADVLGRLVIDLDSIMNGTSKDIILEDGDSINIPKNKQSISVIGEVFVSNSHIFSDGLQISDYINLSGGPTMFADESNIYLIRADGRILSPSQLNSGFFRSSDLYPGDTIVVPLQVQPFSGIRATTEVTQIIYQMALAAAAVNSF